MNKETDIRNHYVIWSAMSMFNDSHGYIYAYLELCIQKRRAKTTRGIPPKSRRRVRILPRSVQ